jgi:secreted Zn-dependent insulinase-like peptidase
MLFRRDNKLNVNFPNIKKNKNILKLKTYIITKHPNKSEINNFVKYSYYIGEFNPLNNLYLLILNIGFSNIFYSDLRSNQQFGYIINANISVKQKYYYFEELVQSDKPIKEIEDAINIFNKNYLNKINEKDFNKFVESAKNILLEKDTKMTDLFLKYFSEILNSSFLFNRKQLLINQLKNIKYNNFKIFYNNMILKGYMSKSIIYHI